MNSTVVLLSSYAINAAWQVGVVGLAAWLLCRFLRRLGPEVQHKIWVSTLIMATFLPLSPMLTSRLAPEQTREAIVVTGLPVTSSANPDVAAAYIMLPPTAVYALAAIYIAVLLFFASRLCWIVRCTIRLVRTGNPAQLSADMEALWRRSCQTFSVTDARLLCSPDVPGPLTAGLRPLLIVPEGFFENHSRDEILAALGHECAHITRGDFRKNLCYESISLLTAFHPVTWFIKARIAQTREMICDRTAAERLLDRQSYALSLLQLAGKVRSCASARVSSHAVGIFDATTLEGRIMALSATQPRVGRVERCLRCAAAALMLSLAVTVTGAMTQSFAAEQKKPAKKTQTAAKDLSCTYWSATGNAHEGTCGFDKNDNKTYRCYSNEDRSLSQIQIGCKSKLLKR